MEVELSEKLNLKTISMWFLHQRKLEDLYFRLYGECISRILGRNVPSIDFYSKEFYQKLGFRSGDEIILKDIGTGFSIYPYQIANKMIKLGFGVNLIIVEPNNYARRFHEIFYYEGVDACKKYLKDRLGIWTDDLKILEKINPKKFSVEIEETYVQDRIPYSDITIASYVLNYLKKEDVIKALAKLYSTTGKLGIVIALRDRNEVTIQGSIRKKCFIYGSPDPLVDNDGIEITSIIKEYDKKFSKRGTLFFAHSKELRPDPLFPRYLWSNLNLIFMDSNHKKLRRIV